MNTEPRHPVLNCRCVEGRIVTPGGITWTAPVHNCAYIAARNKLIPEAEAAALKAAPRGARDPAWSVAFAAAMARLARERLT
ncbi:MAG TPA: hypothetical protein VIH11_01885 [Gemmatimonadaceae bacterium]